MVAIQLLFSFSQTSVDTALWKGWKWNGTEKEEWSHGLNHICTPSIVHCPHLLPFIAKGGMRWLREEQPLLKSATNGGAHEPLGIVLACEWAPFSPPGTPFFFSPWSTGPRTVTPILLTQEMALPRWLWRDSNFECRLFWLKRNTLTSSPAHILTSVPPFHPFHCLGSGNSNRKRKRGDHFYLVMMSCNTIVESQAPGGLGNIVLEVDGWVRGRLTHRWEDLGERIKVYQPICISYLTSV